MTHETSEPTDAERTAAEPIIQRLLADPPTVRNKHDDSLDAAAHVWAASLYGYAAKPSLFSAHDFGVISVNTVA